jgi:hypothetical protein
MVVFQSPVEIREFGWLPKLANLLLGYTHPPVYLPKAAILAFGVNCTHSFVVLVAAAVVSKNIQDSPRN